MIDINETKLRSADLNLLLVFVALLRERSVTRAAGRLRLSQAAVSAALGRLRRLFDDPLFVRAPGGMTPTPRALELATLVEPALDRLDEALRGPANFDPARSVRVFTLGMSDDVEAHLLPGLVRSLRVDAPGLSVIVRQANRRVVARMLDDGDIDLGLAVAPELVDHHRQETVFESGYLCLFSRSRLRLPTPITLADYLAHPHILVSFDGRRGIVDDLLDAQGLRRTVLAATTHFAAVMVILKAVPAIATIPAHAATVFARTAGLTLSPPPIAMPDFAISQVWAASRSTDPALTWLRTRIRQVMRATG